MQEGDAMKLNRKNEYETLHFDGGVAGQRDVAGSVRQREELPGLAGGAGTQRTERRAQPRGRQLKPDFHPYDAAFEEEAAW